VLGGGSRRGMRGGIWGENDRGGSGAVKGGGRI